MKLESLKIAIYADGADLGGMLEMYRKGFIKGFTTNPSLMKKAGIKSYTEFAKNAVQAIPDLPISFEVFTDDFETMKAEALSLAQYGKQVFVKIPVVNTKGESNAPLISALSKEGVQLNVTAVFTVDQVPRANHEGNCCALQEESRHQELMGQLPGGIQYPPSGTMRGRYYHCYERPIG